MTKIHHTIAAPHGNQSHHLRHSTSVVTGAIVIALIALALLFTVPHVLGQSLVNGNFDGVDNSGLIGNSMVYPLQPGVWGTETATITVPSYTSAHSLSNALEMASNAGDLTEAWQFINVGSGSGRTANLSAWLDSNSSNAVGGISLIFYANNTDWGNQLDESSTSLNLDSNKNSWQELSLTDIAVPEGITWVAIHLDFNNASLGGKVGDFDDVQFSISSVPEPSTWALLVGSVGGLIVLNRFRRGIAG